jgi:hypothetical protein
MCTTPPPSVTWGKLFVCQLIYCFRFNNLRYKSGKSLIGYRGNSQLLLIATITLIESIALIATIMLIAGSLPALVGK